MSIPVPIPEVFQIFDLLPVIESAEITALQSTPAVDEVVFEGKGDFITLHDHLIHGLCAAGIAMIVNPVEADVLIAVVLGVWLIATGVSELVSASVSPSRFFLSGSGILSILIGILLVIAPFAGLAAFSTIVAVLLLISGIEMLVLVFGLRVPGLSSAKQGKDQEK